MKKLLLTLASGLLMSASLFAQTHSDLSGNKPSPTGNGYTFQFNGSAANNCFAGGGVAYDAMPANQTWSIPGNDSLQVVVPVMTAYDDTRQRANVYSGDCDPVTPTVVNLSAAADKKLKISLKSTDNGQMVFIFYSGAQSNYGAPGVNVFDVAIGANTFEVSTLDLTGITDETQIDNIGFFFRGPSGWGDFDFAGTVKIDYIKFGDDVVAGTKDQIVDNSLISVYPNPASENVTVDLSALNGQDASVKVMNSLGAVVKEEVTNKNVTLNNLDKGMYFVQVTSGNKVSNKKLIVQ